MCRQGHYLHKSIILLFFRRSQDVHYLARYFCVLEFSDLSEGHAYVRPYVTKKRCGPQAGWMAGWLAVQVMQNILLRGSGVG